MAWQTVDTAPKDGSKIDVWIQNLEARKDAYLRVPNAYWKPDSVAKTFVGGYWVFDKAVDTYQQYPHPIEGSSVRITHWMPRPAGPI